MNVWSLESAHPGAELPLQTRCSSDRHGQDCICSVDPKDEDKRTLIDPEIVRDVIIGLSDGLTVPFALTAGLSSLGESRLVVLGGMAELIAGAISMGIGGFLASQAERDHYQFSKRRISAQVQRSCDDEIEREIYAILGPAGVDGRTAQAVTNSLRAVESERSEGPVDEERQQLRWKDDARLTAFLLKFGEGQGDTNRKTLPLCHNNRTRLPGRRHYPVGSVLLRQSRARRFALLLHPHWGCLACIRRR